MTKMGLLEIWLARRHSDHHWTQTKPQNDESVTKGFARVSRELGIEIGEWYRETGQERLSFYGAGRPESSCIY
jgi:hypothetical protein